MTKGRGRGNWKSRKQKEARIGNPVHVIATDHNRRAVTKRNRGCCKKPKRRTAEHGLALRKRQKKERANAVQESQRKS